MQTHGWYNLGYWDGSAVEFADAACQLARMIGAKAGLQEPDHVLDIGVGQGGQLKLWADEFKPGTVTALEPDTHFWRKACHHAATAVTVLNVPFETFDPRPFSTISKVICVDAAYHIARNKFWMVLATFTGLQRVVLTDLYLLRAPFGWKERLKLRLVGLLTGIPSGNLRTRAEYEMLEGGFSVEEWIDLTEPVIDGFCDFVERPVTRLWSKRFSLKIKITRVILRNLRRKNLIGYALVVAVPLNCSETVMNVAHQA